MSKLQEKAQGIFARFTERLAKVDLRLAVAIPAAVGVITVMGGAIMEMNGQMGLLQHGGISALNAYKDAMAAANLPIGEWITQGIAGKLHSFGGDVQARGFALMTAAPVISAASVMLGRGFSRMKESLAGMARDAQQRAMTLSPPQTAIPVADVRPATPAPGRFRAPEVGAVEMLQRLARSYGVDAKSLTLNGDTVLVGRADERRILTTIDSRFWQETKQDALAAHALAHERGMDPDSIYVREGRVYQVEPESFVDTMITSTDAPTWAQAQRKVIEAQLDDLFDVSQASEHKEGLSLGTRADAARERFLSGLTDAPATEAPDSPVVRYRPA